MQEQKLRQREDTSIDEEMRKLASTRRNTPPESIGHGYGWAFEWGCMNASGHGPRSFYNSSEVLSYRLIYSLGCQLLAQFQWASYFLCLKCSSSQTPTWSYTSSDTYPLRPPLTILPKISVPTFYFLCPSPFLSSL